MTIHKEGYTTIAISALLFGALNMIFFYFFSASMPVSVWIFFAVSLIALLFVISFFRIPLTNLTLDPHQVIAPADGKVVVIEEVFDEEYYKDKRLQVSIFMSPANVHVNRNPISGEVLYSKYHKGKYLVAWHPKSSLENERHSVVIKNNSESILIKQIAGAVAKRIINYLQVGQNVEQGAELGFIKFGSRVDLLLPLSAKVNVTLNQTVKGGVTLISTLQ
ncbi:MAG: phosphatidylserine decarboxylase family protein [Ginsengibacter sp.]